MRKIEFDLKKQHNIVLIGFMGTGKSTVGRRLAKILGWNFVDTDAQIEELTGMSISEIFRRHGETRFRSEENLLVKRLQERKKCVIATGGGTVLNPENWEALAENGLIISLLAPLDEIYERIGYRNDRPLLRGDRAEIEERWTVRQPIYNQADLIIDTVNKGVDEVVREIVEKIEGGAGADVEGQEN